MAHVVASIVAGMIIAFNLRLIAGALQEVTPGRVSFRPGA
jgi:hypothetical protein